MQKNTRTILAILVVIAFIATGFFVNQQNKKSAANQTQPAQSASETGAVTSETNPTAIAQNSAITKPSAETIIINSSLTEQLPGDLVLGNPKAPVTLIEYASLSCPHCAVFYNDGFAKLKADYIDSKKVKFIYRDFPLNQPALFASMISLCYAEDNKNNRPEKYYDFLKVLFKTQESWAFDEQFIEKIRSIAKLSGMSSQRFDSCLKNEKLQERILQNRLDAAKILNIKSTPTFVVNGAVINGYGGFDEIKNAIDAALSKGKR